MTRFLLTIDRAVDTIFGTLEEGRRGETFIPIIPSATVINVAKALIRDRNIEIKITGIRPGEKLHEIMVSEEECGRVVRRGEYYVILPMLPELKNGQHESTGVMTSEYSSADHVMSYTDTLRLLIENDLMIQEDLQPAELLR